MKLAVISLLAAGLIGIQPAQSETLVSGEIETTTWTSDGSPYRVTDTLYVLTGHSLTIEPGVDVLFDADVTFSVEGSIHAVGTELDSIRFLAGADTVWGGLRISGGESSILNYVRVSDVRARMMRPTDLNGGGVIVWGDGTNLSMAHSVLSSNTSVGEFDGVCEWQAGKGGGMLVVDGASVHLTDCLFKNNRAFNVSDSPYGTKPGQATGPVCRGPSSTRGGGLAVDSDAVAVVVGCTFVDNYAIHGGGVSAGGSLVTLLRCSFMGNKASYGGAISGGRADIVECLLTGNSASSGAGVSARYRSMSIVRSVISGNTARHYGGGVYASASGAIASITSVSLLNCVIANNSSNIYGGGLCIRGDIESPIPFVTIVNCTIASNDATQEGGGIWARVFGGSPWTMKWGTTVAMANTIVWANQINEIERLGNTVIVTDYSIVQGDTVWSGEQNLKTDPLFVDPAGGDYRLQAGSPAIDAGDPSMSDPDGSRLDIGALPYGGGTPVAVAEGLRPGALTLSAAPNPFNPSTLLTYGVAKPGGVQLRVYNLAGQLVRTLVDEPRGAGAHSIQWNGEDTSGRVVASGVYIVRLTTSSKAVVQRITLLR
jgi:predicted outer membrane repeat protein